MHLVNSRVRKYARRLPKVNDAALFVINARNQPTNNTLHLQKLADTLPNLQAVPSFQLFAIVRQRQLRSGRPAPL